jgi:Tfp pilus assembly protein PilO
MFKYNLSKRERSVLVITIGIAVLAVAYAFVIEPILGKSNMLNEQIRSKKSYILKNRVLLSKFKSLEEEYKRYPSLTVSAESEEKEVAKALSSIENISHSSSCPIADVKPRASKNIGSYKEILFEVATESGIDELSRFLYEIETSKDMLRVKHFTIASKSGSSNTLKGSLLIGRIIAK